MGLASGAYLGLQQIVGTYLDESRRHESTFSLGFTQDSGVGPIWQYSYHYLWSVKPPPESTGSEILWNPFLIGAFITYTDNTYFYVDTEDPYPQDRYYDVTSIRWGLHMSSQLQNVQWGGRAYQISLSGSLLERAFTNFFNNPGEPDLFKFYWSLGLSIKTSL